MDLKQIRNRIRSLRMGSGLSMKALAEKITEQTGVTISSGQISDWENGYKNPSAPGLIALSLFFQVSTDWILKGSDVPDEQMELILQFHELSDPDRAFVKRYLQLALFHKEITVPSRTPSGRLLRRTRIHPLKKLPAMQEQASEYTMDSQRTIPLLKPEAASRDMDWLSDIDGYIHSTKPLEHCFAIAVPASTDSSADGPSHDVRYFIIQPQNSYEPEDQVAIRTADGFAVDCHKNSGNSTVLGKVISEATPPSK